MKIISRPIIYAAVKIISKSTLAKCLLICGKEVSSEKLPKSCQCEIISQKLENIKNMKRC